MSDLLVRGGQVLTPKGRVEADVLIHDGRIVEIGSGPGMLSSGTTSQGQNVVEAAGLVVAPGLIDLQVNGAGGIDLTAQPQRLWEVAEMLPQWGVTSWLPTIITSPEDVRRTAMSTLVAGTDRDATVATPLGLHFEGPFLAPDGIGAHDPAWVREPSLERIEGWSHLAGVALVTLAPEVPGALDVIRVLVERGVVVSMGHSSASYAEAAAGVDAGARWVTHLFNVMRPLHHREPGLIGFALTDERVRVGVISDGVHVHPKVVELAVQAMGSRLTLVTDAVAALGTTDTAAVRLDDGTLAGSTTSLNKAVANLVEFAGLDADDALRAATEVPASVLGLEHERGVVAPGAVGDLVLLDAATNVIATVIGGQLAYNSRS